MNYSGVKVYNKSSKRTRRVKYTIYILRKICGAMALVCFVLALGKIGAADCGATWEGIFPSTLYLVAGFLAAFFMWEFLGGNK